MPLLGRLLLVFKMLKANKILLKAHTGASSFTHVHFASVFFADSVGHGNLVLLPFLPHSFCLPAFASLLLFVRKQYVTCAMCGICFILGKTCMLFIGARSTMMGVYTECVFGICNNFVYPGDVNKICLQLCTPFYIQTERLKLNPTTHPLPK